ncbi:hypothetical protein BJ912DRAFT_920884 [Pholiota molesta]|nr:hypothetical protein BJ912DRAFT_920884 [Pholiota molesta]
MARFTTFLEVAAKKNKKAMRSFYDKAIEEFCEAWPMIPLTPEEVAAAEDVNAATQAKQTVYNNRVEVWFNNHKRRLGQKKGSKKVLNLQQAQPRVLLPWQAYSTIMYPTWKPLIDQGYEEYKVSWAIAHPEEKPNKTRMRFMQDFLQEKLDNETPEMKERTEKKRFAVKAERQNSTPLGGDEAAKEKMEDAIQALPRTLTNIGHSVLKQTGWNITMIVGGPSPDGDQLMSYAVHVGQNEDGKKFNQFLGNTAYKEHILEQYDNFLNDCFKKKTGSASQTLVAKPEDLIPDDDESSDEEETGMKGYGEGNGGDDNGGDEHEGNDDDDEDNVGNDGEGDSGGEVLPAPKVQKAGKSEYELRKEQNMAYLQVKLAEVKASYPIDTIEPVAKKLRKPRSKNKKDEGEQGGRRESARLKSSSETVSAQQNSSSEAVSAQQIADKPSGGDDTDSPGTPLLENNLQQSSTTPAIDGPNSVIQDSTTQTQPQSIGVDKNKHADAPEADTQPGSHDKSNDDTMMEDENINAAATTTTTSTEEDLPDWLGQRAVYLREVSSDTQWQQLLEKFFAFERSGPPNGLLTAWLHQKLPTTSRPDELAAWIKSKKKDIIPTISLASYGSGFQKWWVAMQPQWRIQGDGCSLSKDLHAEETWQMLRKGGTAGIYIIVIGLSWWLRQAADNDNSLSDAWIVINDLSWVLQQMNEQPNEQLASVSNKRRHDQISGEAGGRKPKR